MSKNRLGALSLTSGGDAHLHNHLSPNSLDLGFFPDLGRCLWAASMVQPLLALVEMQQQAWGHRGPHSPDSSKEGTCA